MNIYDENGDIVMNYDPKKGRLETKTHTIHHDAVEAVEQQGHWETIAVYQETGGEDVEWVVDVPGVQGQEAWDEKETYWLYIPYTEEELAQIEANKNRPSVEELLKAMVEGIESA